MKDRIFELNKNFDRLIFSDYILVDNTQVRLAIDDLTSKFPDESSMAEFIDLIVMSSRGTLSIYKDIDLLVGLRPSINSFLEGDHGNTLLIFPGEGAKNVKRLLDFPLLKKCPILDLTVERILVDGSVNSVRILTGKNEVRQTLWKQLSTCIVFDDVLLTGSTMEAVKEIVDPKEKLRWQCMTLMQLSPFQNSQRQLVRSGLPGFEGSISTVVYEGMRGIPSNFSLSTLIGNNKKSLLVREKYRNSYVENMDLFDMAVNELRNLTK